MACISSKRSGVFERFKAIIGKSDTGAEYGHIIEHHHGVDGDLDLASIQAALESVDPDGGQDWVDFPSYRVFIYRF